MYMWQMRVNVNGVVKIRYREALQGMSNVTFANQEMLEGETEVYNKFSEVVSAAKNMCFALNIKEETTINGYKKATISCTKPYIDADIHLDEYGNVKMKVNISAAMRKAQYDAIFAFGEALKEHSLIC